ncbi:hypothetical protein B0H16DRAFT_1583092 [Mycena metata]|uniref:Secreted protein n=1 Tax=Mycena metata TaxID=1033252 RepID=A0AAD7I0S6_9AGAR|nr:hypothetical protein B0H16DRAFT_1583092 [Mycena metata]
MWLLLLLRILLLFRVHSRYHHRREQWFSPRPLPPHRLKDSQEISSMAGRRRVGIRNALERRGDSQDFLCAREI